MTHWRSISLAFFLLISSFTGKGEAAGGFLKPKYCAIVVDMSTNEVLYAHEPDRISHPASPTKIIALYILFKALKAHKVTLDTLLPVSKHAQDQAPTKLGLRAGQKISVRDAIMGMIVKSANDASVAVAEYFAGSESSFAALMTQEARRLGMANTVFTTVSGLPNPGNVSTVRDMATASMAMIRDFPEHYHLFSAKSFTFQGVKLMSHNKLIGTNGVDGIKTGFTNASGFTLSASAARENRRIVAVIFGAPNRIWRDKQMLDLINTSFNRIGLGVGGTDYPGPYNHPVEKKKQAKLDYLVNSLEHPKIMRSQKMVKLAKKKSRKSQSKKPSSKKV